MSRVPVVDKAVGMIRSRFLTIYLWHSVAIVLAVRLLDSNRRTAMLDNTSVLGSVLRYGTTWLLTIIACVLFGWVEDLGARRPMRIIPWPRTPRHPNRPSEVAADSWLARLPLRSRPLLLTGTAIVAAAFVAGALLWPWSEHHTYHAPVGSLGQAVDPHGNGARSPVHSGPPSSQPDQLPATSEGPIGISPAPRQPTVDPRIPPADRGALTQTQPPSGGSSASAAPGSAAPSSGPAASPGRPTATAAPTGQPAQSTAAWPAGADSDCVSAGADVRRAVTAPPVASGPIRLGPGEHTTAHAVITASERIEGVAHAGGGPGNAPPAAARPQQGGIVRFAKARSARTTRHVRPRRYARVSFFR
jgi:hypothetical protein